MTPDQRERISGIVDVLLGTPLDRRPAAMDALCPPGADDAVRDEVARLLDDDTDLVVKLKSIHDETPPIKGTATPIQKDAPPPAAVIGRYHLKSRLGGGGMGEVFLAEQHTPIRRTVAIKLIKAGFDTHEVIARFSLERQALAKMDHPGIARVLDAGATDTGRPYFVMERVDGVPITAFADEHHLSIERRLLLFIDVCEAVAHAHTKAIIHRDLKPSNVLAFMGEDGAPRVKVIDFGIAKALDDRSDRAAFRTYATAAGTVIGTYEYMSPEQAAASPDADTRSDVYSLGVLLYELLAGVRPFERDATAKNADEELRRAIAEIDPPRPSAKLSSLSREDISSKRLQEISASRGIDPKNLIRRLARELEWIPLRALRKEPQRRYASAAELAGDVRHFLAGEPLAAAPESRFYRLGKFARRHRAALSIAGAIALSLLAGSAFYVRGIRAEQKRTLEALHEVERQRTAADTQRDAAKQSEAIAQAVSDFQSKMLAAADPLMGKGDAVTVAQILDSARKELDAGAARDQPLVEARLQQIIGQTYWSLARFADAEPLLRAALNTHRAHLEHSDERIDEDLVALAELLKLQRRTDDALPVYQEIAERAVRYRGAESWDALLARSRLITPLVDAGRVDEAKALHAQAAADIARNPAMDDNCRAELAITGGKISLASKDYASAEAQWRELLAIRQRQVPHSHYAVGMGFNLVGNALTAQKRLAEADEFYRQSLAEYRSMPGNNPFIGAVLQSLTRSLLDQMKFDEAERTARELVELRLKSFPPEHSRVCDARRLLAESLSNSGRHQESVTILEEVISILRTDQPARRRELINTLAQLTAAQRAGGDEAAASRTESEMNELRKAETK